MITLYTTHCVRCKVLETKLDNKKVSYDVVDDIAKLKELGLQDAFFPILEVDGKRLSFGEANKFVESL